MRDPCPFKLNEYQAHLASQYRCDTNNASSAKQWPKCQQTCVITAQNKNKTNEKNVLQKGTETDWLKLRRKSNSQLSWFVCVVLTTSNDSCSLSSLYTSAFNAL